MQLSDAQARAVKHLSDRGQWRNRHAWLAGYAGSGKTSIAPYLVEAIGARRPLYCAPTNKAAKILGEKVGKPASSIHSAIYFPPEEKKGGALGWTINPDGAAGFADLIVVDEASMVGQRLGADLMTFGVPVLAIGDPGQLPPVQDEPFFCTGQPDFLLEEIHRQAADSPIIALSQRVRAGERLRPGRMGDDVLIAKRGTIDIPDKPPQVIVGTHKRRWMVTAAIRGVLGHDNDGLPEPGEPLVVRKNSEHHSELTNGQEAVTLCVETSVHNDHCLDVWTNLNRTDEPYKSWDGLFVEHWRREQLRPDYLSPEWLAMKEYEAFDFGWAITCHVAQGSQWDEVIVYDESGVFRADAARWLYTAVTRAAKKLTVIV